MRSFCQVKSFYPSYLKAFINFADFQLRRSLAYKQIIIFANLLTQKANDLVRRGSLNNIDIYKLQKELFQMGKNYVNSFAKKFRSTSLGETKKKSQAEAMK